MYAIFYYWLQGYKTKNQPIYNIIYLDLIIFIYIYIIHYYRPITRYFLTYNRYNIQYI